MNNPVFSDAALREAAGLVSRSMLAALPAPEDCVFEPSPELHKRLLALLRRSKRSEALRKWSRSAAAVLLAATLAGGAWLTVDAEARQALFAWVRDVYEEHIVYRFFGKPAAETLPTYRITWLPEGYEEISAHNGKVEYSARYQKGGDIFSEFAFSYSFAQDNHFVEFLLFNEDDYIFKTIAVNGIQADFYQALVPGETNTLIWLDEDVGIVFDINGFLDESVMLHIAESIILANHTK